MKVLAESKDKLARLHAVWGLTQLGASAEVAKVAGDADADVDPRLDPAMNAPLVAFLASDRAGHVNGQLFGRTDFSYSLFQHPKQIAWMHKDGGWDTESVAEQFDAMLGQHLQTVGMVMPSGLTQDAARK